MESPVVSSSYFSMLVAIGLRFAAIVRKSTSSDSASTGDSDPVEHPSFLVARPIQVQTISREFPFPMKQFFGGLFAM